MRQISTLIALALLGCAQSAPPVVQATPVPSAPPVEVKLHALVGENMVMQRDIAVPIWGTTEPGYTVAVEMAGQKKSTTAGRDGRWMVKLDPLKAGGPHEMVVSAGIPVTVKNILVGDVWVCSGQSNMEMSVKSSADSEAEIAAARYPKIRLFTAPKRPSDAPQRDVNGSWKECAPESVPGFSAVAYFFGRELQKALDVPMGLIHSSWGGTAAELWVRREVLEGNPDFSGLLEAHVKRVQGHKAAVEKAKAEGKPAPRTPGPGPTQLYNGMIAPLLPYAIRGAIWYQGESNASRAAQYRTLFPAMIKNWREDWGQGDFPFLFVQLANYLPRKPEPGPSSWAELREAQLMTLSLPKTGQAVIIDIGDARDIHPKNKQDVGKRLALSALHVTYGKELVHSGPVYDSMKVEGEKIRLRFLHVGGGLEARGGKLTGFSVAGEDGKFAWAEARIDEGWVVVWSDAVPAPKAARYAWADNPECSLYNKEGLPATPFRTDRP